VWLVRNLVWLIAVTGIWKILNFGNESMQFELPDYAFGLQ